MIEIDEPGIRRRFLAAFAELKSREEITNLEFAKALGHQSAGLITDLQTGHKKINLNLIVASQKYFSKSQIMSILFSDTDPGLVDIPNLQGLNYNQRLIEKKKHKTPKT